MPGMIHRTAEHYLRQPWKNGRGSTTELWRQERDGVLLARLSRAGVVEDGPFSRFPRIARNLTVLSGPGFRLVGEGIDLRCDPLVPVAFPGDAAVVASGTGAGPSEDFNVMTADFLPLPRVWVAQHGVLPAGGLLALLALGPIVVNGRQVGRDDLILTEGAVTLAGEGPVIAVRFHGLPAPGPKQSRTMKKPSMPPRSAQ